MIFVAVAVGLFLTGALFGIYMFVRHLRRRNVPAWAAVAHGAFGATAFGIVLLVMATVPGMALLPQALGILIGAIFLGVMNLVFHIRRVRHRTILIVMHAMAAVIGVGTLAYAGILHATHRGLPAPADSSTPIPNPTPLVAAAPPPTATATAPTPAAAALAPAADPAKTAPPFPVGLAWTDRTIAFDKASVTLDARTQASLAAVAADMQAHPEITLVEVQGHTDENGDAATNIKLSRTRAAAAVDFLVAKGITRSRLRSAGYGAFCPADPSCASATAPSSCHEPSSWERDRRITVMILESRAERFHGKVTCDSAMSLAPREDQRYAL